MRALSRLLASAADVQRRTTDSAECLRLAAAVARPPFACREFAPVKRGTNMRGAAVIKAGAVVLVAAAGAAADVTPIWTLTHREVVPLTAEALATDSAGNSFVAATLGDPPVTDIVLARFDSDGSLVWERTFSGPVGQDLAADVVLDAAEEAVYLVGRSATDPTRADSDYLIVKYDAVSGVEQWQQFYDGPAGGVDDPLAAAATPDGGVAITGEVWNGDERSDYGTIKLDAEGMLEWEQVFSGPGGFIVNDDKGEVLAVAADGDVIVSGVSRPASGGNDIVTFRYDSATGAQQWEARYSTSANERVNDIALAPDGDVVLVGTDPFGIDRQWLTVRYDGATGAQEWVAIDDPGFDEFAAAVTVGADGSVYVTGNTDPDGDDGNGNDNLVVIAYEGATGAQRWLDEFGGEQREERDAGFDLRITAAGTLAVVGRSSTLAVSGDVINTDAIVREYDPLTGALLDMESLDSTAPGGETMDEIFRELVLDGAGNLYAMGTVSGDLSAPLAIYLAKFGVAGGCRADLDGDGKLDFFDFLAFQELFAAGDPQADFTGDGVLDFFDFLAFQGEFAAGCD